MRFNLMRRSTMRYFLVLFLILITLSGCAGTADTASETPLPFDPSVIRGTLENGLTYFIHENHEPENRISMRLYVNAGSVLEDEDQEGIAHLLEHMAFNGTVNFGKQELEQYLESLGMEFGPDLNASTNFDETIYKLEIPADNPETVAKGLLVLRDWATGLLLEPDAINEERLVVREEWRLRRGAQARIRDEQIPKLLEGSRYAERIPIGDMQDVMNTPAGRIRDFYEKWYRPELMAISVVGDIDPARAEQLIRENFAFASPQETVKRPVYPVPLSQENEVLVLTDPELTIGRAEIMTKLEPRGLTSREDYIAYIREILFWNMLNTRLEELTKSENPPYLRAGGSSYPYVRTVELSYLTARARPEEIMGALETLLVEAKRAADFGFTPLELKREGARVLKAVENAYLERENRDSSSYSSEIGKYFLEGAGMPGIEYEYQLFSEIVPAIELDEINALSQRFFPATGRLITLSLPETNDVPSRSEVMELHNAIMNRELSPYAEETIDAPLIGDMPPAGEVVTEEKIASIGTSIYTLSNGMRLVLKPTDLQKNRVLFSGFSPGGESLIDTGQLPAARTAVLIRQESGLGEYNATQLEKYLSDKDVSLNNYIGRYSEGFSGDSSTADIEYLMQLIYLNFTAPRFDNAAFESVRNRLSTSVANRDKSPQTVFSDTINRLLTGGSPRREPFTLETVEQMDLASSETIFRERFSDADDFTLIFVGDFAEEQLLDLAKRYLAVLSSRPGAETPQDRGIRPVEPPVTETVRRGIEDQASVVLLYSTPQEWSEESAIITSTSASILENILGEKIREALGGTYSVSAWASLNRLPYEYAEAGIYFGTDPARVKELTDAVVQATGELAQEGPEARFVDNAEEAYRRRYEEQLEQNDFWLNHLESALRFGEDPADLLTPEEYASIIDADAVRLRMGEIFRNDELIEVRLLPEDQN